MFRLATSEDYEYLLDIGLYELMFDKRPVLGVRCEDPKQGAEDYNNFRKKFKAVIHKKNQSRKKIIAFQSYHGMQFLTGRLIVELQKNGNYY